MIGKFTFIGRDKSMGYRKGITYNLNVLLNDQFIVVGKGKNFLYETQNPFLPAVPYTSWSAFFKNWQPKQ